MSPEERKFHLGTQLPGLESSVTAQGKYIDKFLGIDPNRPRRFKKFTDRRGLIINQSLPDIHNRTSPDVHHRPRMGEARRDPIRHEHAFAQNSEITSLSKPQNLSAVATENTNSNYRKNSNTLTPLNDVTKPKKYIEGTHAHASLTHTTAPSI